MTRRRVILVGAIVLAVLATAIGVYAYRSPRHSQSGCDTVSALIAYNKEFAQTQKSAVTDKAAPASPDQFREWASRIKDYADQISDPALSGNAQTAAELAGRLADLVPRYRAKPDDKAVTRDYANIGIEFGNAVNRLDYSCLPAG